MGAREAKQLAVLGLLGCWVAGLLGGSPNFGIRVFGFGQWGLAASRFTHGPSGIITETSMLRPQSWTVRYVSSKGRRAIRRAFPRTFFEELVALRNDLGRIGSHYVRAPGVWLASGLVVWSSYLVVLVAVVELPFDGALNVILDITFAISSPASAVTEAYKKNTGVTSVPASVHYIGSAGWIVLASFVFLMPAVLALMLERLPEIAASLRGLMRPEVWELISDYTTLQDSYRRTIVSVGTAAAEDVEKARKLREDLRADALVAMSEFVTAWYRGDVALHVNASVMRLVAAPPASVSADVLYRPATATATDKYLELRGSAFPDGLPRELFLYVDDAKPRPGAPHAAARRHYDVISNALDRFEWIGRGVRATEVEEILNYFHGVPFRSFISIPLYDDWAPQRPVIGVLNVQVDRAGVFEAGNRDTSDLVDLLGKLCYFVAWIER